MFPALLPTIVLAVCFITVLVLCVLSYLHGKKKEGAITPPAVTKTFLRVVHPDKDVCLALKIETA